MEQVYANKESCCGCGGCASVCPRNAISMREDKQGFIYPVIDRDKCIDCKLCAKQCAYVNKVEVSTPIVTYAAASKSECILRKSASGGIFMELARGFLKSGYVIGAATHYCKDGLKVSHIIANSEDQLSLIQGSKYVQSEISCYDDVRKLLESGKKCLFSGTPCQVSEVKRIFKKYSDLLYTVDIICHGVPNQKFLNSYLNELKKKDEIESFLFRDKRYGWGLNASADLIDNQGNKKHIPIAPINSSYYMYFLKGEIYRKNCYSCPYASTSRCGDITIGDYWGVEEFNPELLVSNGGQLNEEIGISCVLLNTEKGKILFDSIKNNLLYAPVKLEDVVTYNHQLARPTTCTADRDWIFKVFEFGGYRCVEAYYKLHRFMKRCIRAIKRRVHF